MIQQYCSIRKENLHFSDYYVALCYNHHDHLNFQEFLTYSYIIILYINLLNYRKTITYFINAKLKQTICLF